MIVRWPMEFFLNGVELSVDSANARNVINH